MAWAPPLRLDATGDGCRLVLVGVAHGNGRTLQEAADDLVGRVLAFAMAVRGGGVRWASELGPPDRRLLDYVWELGERAARGEDIRQQILRAG
jgi:hypothetical protein